MFRLFGLAAPSCLCRTWGGIGADMSCHSLPMLFRPLGERALWCLGLRRSLCLWLWSCVNTPRSYRMGRARPKKRSATTNESLMFYVNIRAALWENDELDLNEMDHMAFLTSWSQQHVEKAPQASAGDHLAEAGEKSVKRWVPPGPR